MNEEPHDGQNDKPISGDGRPAGPEAGESRNSRPDHDDTSGSKSADVPETESDGERAPFRRNNPAGPGRTPEDTRLTGIGGWLVTYIVFQALNILPFLNNLRSEGVDDALQLDPLAAAEIDRLNGIIFVLDALSITGIIVCLYLLFQRKKSAVRANRILLTAQSVFIVFAFLLMSEPLQQFLGEAQYSILLVGIALQVLCNGLWFAYFGKSRRVALTFTE